MAHRKNEKEEQGVVVVAQEDRFRIQTDDGRSLLFVLLPGANVSMEDLEAFAAESRRVVARYEGEPDAGAVAIEVKAA